MKKNKYNYFHVLQGHYSQGWEDLCAGSKKEMYDNLNDYQINEGGSYRIIKRREIAEYDDRDTEFGPYVGLNG